MTAMAPTPEEQIRQHVAELCKGNPGAIRVLVDVYQSEGAKSALEIYRMMREMNITGPNVWLAFKDASGQDLQKMIASIKSNDPGLIATINRCASSGTEAKTR
jgi:hypothetical protein